MANRLSEVRLGRLERQLFREAPSSEAIAPLVVDPPDAPRAVQHGYLRASKRLAKHGLVERRLVMQGSRAADRRLERPFYKDGRFWLRRETMRSQPVRRVVIWCTPFGDAIRRFYERELYEGRSIRWDDGLVRMAERTAARNGVDVSLREGWLQEQRGYVMSPPTDMLPRHEPPVEYLPEFVAGEAQLRRWSLACRAARRRHPTVGSERLLEEAVALYSSDQADEVIEAMAPGRGSPPRYRVDELGRWTRI